MKTTFKNFYNEPILKEKFNEIRTLEKEGTPRHKIADRFHCCLSVIDNICNLGRQDLDEKEVRKRNIVKQFRKKIRERVFDEKLQKAKINVDIRLKEEGLEQPKVVHENKIVETETEGEFRIGTKSDKHRRFKERGVFE